MLKIPTDAPTIPDDPAINYTFPLDIWQQHAVAAIHRGDNVLVTAKTGSGKTLVAEYQIAYSLRNKKRVFYTTPIKSLSNQKYHDLKHLFPGNSVGIMTGDIKSNPEADIVIMTTEILRNLLYKQNTSTASIGISAQLSLADVEAVVFDEVHYINDPERGHVWEEILILLPPAIRLILLSATIDSPELFAEWVGAAKQKPIVLLKTSHRIVPLVHALYDPTKEPLPIQALKSGDEAAYQAEVYKAWLRTKDARIKAAEDWVKRVAAANAAGDSVAGKEGKVKAVHFTHTLNQCIDDLKRKDLLPALFFVFSRKECERYADLVTGSLIDSSDTSAVKHIISFHLHKYDETLKHLPQFHQITRLLERGIAFHHSGLLPLLKEIVEILFARGYIRVLFCTETFAVGLNMPARTVVFLDLKKPSDSGGFRPLRPDEYIQMAGRAGRRGKDTQGLVLYLPSRNPLEPEELRGIFTGALVPLESRLQFHYDFILKALHTPHNPENPVWKSIIDSSYWNQQRLRAIQVVDADIEHIAAQLQSFPLKADFKEAFEEEETLVVAMKGLTNAAKNRAAQALSHWRDRHRGPVWTEAKQVFIQLTTLQGKHAKRIDDRARMNYSIEEHRITPVLKALREWGACCDKNILTIFGILATEVNEGNSLLIARLYESKLLQGAAQEEIIATLGAFIVDRESREKTQHPLALPFKITERVKNILVEIDEWGTVGNHIDCKYGVESPDNYWSLATLWVEIGFDWATGIDAAHISQKYEIYEGNLMKGLLKLTSLVNEWIAIATYKTDVDMLETLKTAQTVMLRDIVQPESLYLRL